MQLSQPQENNGAQTPAPNLTGVPSPGPGALFSSSSAGAGTQQSFFGAQQGSQPQQSSGLDTQQQQSSPAAGFSFQSFGASSSGTAPQASTNPQQQQQSSAGFSCQPPGISAASQIAGSSTTGDIEATTTSTSSASSNDLTTLSKGLLGALLVNFAALIAVVVMRAVLYVQRCRKTAHHSLDKEHNTIRLMCSLQGRYALRISRLMMSILVCVPHFYRVDRIVSGLSLCILRCLRNLQPSKTGVCENSYRVCL
jgi:hypothetical protein